jgi:hypothetical protein
MKRSETNASCTPLIQIIGVLFGTLLIVACGDGDDGRIDVSGTVNINGQPVPSGTLVLTPESGAQMPVAARIWEGKFAFDKATGPRPGLHAANLNRDEPTIEEISQYSQANPSEAARKFNANQSPSPSSSSEVMISEVSGQSISIDLK